jgi:hypothetical protein
LSGNSKSWVAKILHDYNEQGNAEPPPQLSIASWLAAGACTSILYRLATGKSIKQFPEYYFITPGEH